jgi:CRP-like cAMP-binding protein
MREIRTYFDMLIAVDDHPRTVGGGESLFEEGQAGTEMFVVRTGRFELSAGGRTLETIGPGGMIGEMALIDPAPRSATATALEPSAVTVLNAWRFGELVKKVPGLALEVMRIMARRLRQANVAVATADRLAFRRRTETTGRRKKTSRRRKKTSNRPKRPAGRSRRF